MENRAKEIIKDINAGKRILALKLDKYNSPEHFMTFPLVWEINKDLLQGEIIKEVSINEYKEWVKTSNHKYNNDIRKLIADLL